MKFETRDTLYVGGSRILSFSDFSVVHYPETMYNITITEFCGRCEDRGYIENIRTMGGDRVPVRIEKSNGEAVADMRGVISAAYVMGKVQNGGTQYGFTFYPKSGLYNRYDAYTSVSSEIKIGELTLSHVTRLNLEQETLDAIPLSYAVYMQKCGIVQTKTATIEHALQKNERKVIFNLMELGKRCNIEVNISGTVLVNVCRVIRVTKTFVELELYDAWKFRKTQ